MCVYESSFFVEDASGARFQMHRFACRRFWTRSTRYELDTGERAVAVDDQTFAVVPTGERLVRV